MIDLNIPGRGNYKIKYIVCDVNGTLAVDGVLLPDVQVQIQRLMDRVEIFMLTANTHGKQEAINKQLGFNATIIKKGAETDQKKAFVNELGAENVLAIGQGANDAEMLKAAKVGVAVISKEGLAKATLLNADILVPDIQSALGLIENPLRLVATLRK